MTDLATALPNPIVRDFWTRPDGLVDADLAVLRSLPPTFHREEEAENPDLIPQGPGSWAVTRHADILHMSKHPEIFSSAAGVTVFDIPAEFTEFFSSMIAMDDPRHGRLRKLVSAGFTPRMLNKLQDGVRVQASKIVDEVCERGECDFVVDVAARLAEIATHEPENNSCQQLDFVFDQSNVILGAGDPEYVPEGSDLPGAILSAGGALAELMSDVADSKRGTDSDDLTTMLVNAEVDGERLSSGDIASFFILLVVAGNETTRNATSWGLRYLTQFPDQRAIWQADFNGVAPTAVEEIVRLASPVTYMRRTALEDTVVGGQEIKLGEKLCMFYLAANRDEDVFVNPHGFDVLRDPNPHVGFGGPGPHFCLGAHLARREITMMFSELFDRLPDIEAVGEPELVASSFIHGI